MSNPDNNATILDNSLLPAPGATERKKAAPAIAAKPTVRPRKLLSPSELTIEENNYKIKYPHIASGTLTNATKGQPVEGFTPEEVIKFNHKRSCLINCQTKGCTGTRRIATSDLAQVKLCDECTRIARNQRKRERRALAKAKNDTQGSGDSSETAKTRKGTA